MSRSIVPILLSLAIPHAAPALLPGPLPGQGARLLAAAPELERLIFFAVLEGLYEDGVRNDVADVLLRIDPATGGYEHFVWACPICMPTLNAVRVYRHRIDLVGTKIPRDTLGSGLDEGMRERLLSGEREVRLEALNELVERWVGRKLESMRLTASEHAEWRQKLEEGRKLGMEFLATAPGWRGMERCAVCDGANEACGR